MIKHVRVVLTILFVSVVTFSTQVEAQTRSGGVRWFEIEIILFTNNKTDADVAEKFEDNVTAIPLKRIRDLLTPYHYPDISGVKKGLSSCEFPQQPLLQSDIPEEGVLPNILELDKAIINAEPHKVLMQSYQQQPAFFDNTNENESIDNLLNESMQLNNENVNTEGHSPTTSQTDVTSLLADSTALTDEAELALDTFIYNAYIQLFTHNQVFTIQTDCLFPAEVTFIQLPHIEYFNDINYNGFEHAVLKRQIDAIEWEEAGELDKSPYVHLISKNSLQLDDIYNNLRKQPDLKPILHLGWRQPALPRKQTRRTRLYAGKNFTNQYDYFGQPLKLLTPPETVAVDASAVSDSDLEMEQSVSQEELVSKNINELLNKIEQGYQINFETHEVITDEPLEPVSYLPEKVWELDGLFRVHLKHYLFVEAEFNVRKPAQVPLALLDLNADTNNAGHLDVASNKNEVDALNPLAHSTIMEANNTDKETSAPNLKTYYFKQNKRVISGEIHYFDHPHMGMIMQIRKYKH
ncbi:CsiV family protein [Flocculibacter collagenilyticus]|uniref:CsiV family protein n=1 Tax=Flocculibacter collagenilyticus TaxID=2744479 RepID=UPI0018F55468|nr:CsiV family protein [Flocculibacter collagenilyticus]